MFIDCVSPIRRERVRARQKWNVYVQKCLTAEMTPSENATAQTCRSGVLTARSYLEAALPVRITMFWTSSQWAGTRMFLKYVVFNSPHLDGRTDPPTCSRCTWRRRLQRNLTICVVVSEPRHTHWSYFLFLYRYRGPLQTALFQIGVSDTNGCLCYHILFYRI